MAFFLACLLQAALAHGAVKTAPQAPVPSPTPASASVNFSDRLTKSFNTAPIGKTTEHMGSADQVDDDQNVQDKKPIATPYGKNTMDWDPLSE